MSEPAPEPILVDLARDDGPCTDSIELPFADRQKARQRVRAASGCHLGLKLPRGTVLRGGDVLLGEDGRRVRVVAATESVSTVAGVDARTLARAAYHLGNRHVWVEVGDGYLRYLHDHVLDDMLRQLGVAVVLEQAPFEPEAGAYGAHGAGHQHHGHEEP